MSFEQAVDKTIDINAAVFILADSDHESSINAKTIRDVLTLLTQKSPGVDCLFVEAGSNFQGPIDNYLSGQGDYAAIEQENEKLAPLFGGQALNLIPKAVLDQAKSLKLKVRTMDINYFSSEAEASLAFFEKIKNLKDITEDQMAEIQLEHAKINVEGRSKFMAGKIAENVKAGTCKQSVVIVGSAHIGAQYAKITTGLHVFLQQKNLQPQVFGIFDSNQLCKPTDTDDFCKTLEAASGIGSVIDKEYMSAPFSAVFFGK